MQDLFLFQYQSKKKGENESQANEKITKKSLKSQKKLKKNRDSSSWGQDKTLITNQIVEFMKELDVGMKLVDRI